MQLGHFDPTRSYTVDRMARVERSRAAAWRAVTSPRQLGEGGTECGLPQLTGAGAMARSTGLRCSRPLEAPPITLINRTTYVLEPEYYREDCSAHAIFRERSTPHFSERIRSGSSLPERDASVSPQPIHLQDLARTTLVNDRASRYG